MSTVRRRRMMAIGTATAAVLALTGCETGFGTQTNQQYNAGVGTDTRDSSVYVLGALFVDNGDRTATLSASLINQLNTPESLTSVEATDDTGQPLMVKFSGPADLVENAPYVPGKTGDIVLTGDFAVGHNVKVTFTFDKAAAITMNAPIVRRTAMYDSVASGAPTATPSPSATEPTPTS